MASSFHSPPPIEDLVRSCPWYEDVESKLDLGHPFLNRILEHITEGIPVIHPNIHHQPHFPPFGTTTFFLGQFEGGLHLPIPSAYFDILVFFSIPMHQLAPNSIRILAGTIIIFWHLNTPLSPRLFYCLYQLKMVELGVFYFKGCPNCQFLTTMPSSHKRWKHLFFFVRLETPLAFGCS